MGNIKATIITIGDELLIGQTIDTNSAWIAQRLNEIGIIVQRRIAVADEESVISGVLDEEIPRTSIILMTGGLGPTSDDITKPLLSQYFNGKLTVNNQVLAHVQHLFEKRNRPFLEINMKQAEVPDVAEVLFNKIGTAPGMLFKKEGTWIISMPGVPFEMMGIMTDEVLPRLKKEFISDKLIHKTIITSGEGESFIADSVKDIEAALPDHISLAYLPSPGMVKLRLTGTGNNEQKLIEDLAHFEKLFQERLAHIIVAKEDIPLQEIVGRSLKKLGKTVSLAESCTGGYIAHLVTQVQGSSDYFKGAVVPYRSELKHKILGVSEANLEKYSAISEEVAIELASSTAKLFESDYSLSVTGQLSYGGEDGHIPKGVVWMAVTDGIEMKTKKFQFHYDRLINKEMSAQMGLLMLLRFINETQ